ncbi:DUF1214 domain-containing protein [Brevundimonas goettingensis]|uniref:DUF1214 domain-containing protein n=1 Tax=Brevundimonas goettingensis TaxID=2774190 RepID=A0A975BZI5_9CAUL|nr:DUF1214 domain-containing protein [Brevundimonas goettingensis]QTC90811.1 DUF1214 domain-containing protein [Brevundimonas goettingensis]
MLPQSPAPEEGRLTAWRDAHGQWFDGGRAWGFSVPAMGSSMGPAGLPAEGWSVTLYDVETRGFIDTPWDLVGRGSDDALARQADGSVALIFSPQPPADAPRSNWIPTTPGRAWFAVFRFRGAGVEEGWALPEIAAL